MNYRKSYKDLSRRQQLRRLREQRARDHKSLASSLKNNGRFVESEELTTSTEKDYSDIDVVIPLEECSIITNVNNSEIGRANSTEICIENVETCVVENIEGLCAEQDGTEFFEKFDTYSDNEEDISIPPSLSLWEKVAVWALRNYKNRQSVNEILAILCSEGHNLPRDARTLLGTPRKSSNIIPCGSGLYLHYGLERALTDLLQKVPEDAISDHLIIDMNIDGLPLCKSSKSQLWPILAKLEGRLRPEVFVIGAYHGYEKPSSLDEFLNSFIVEYENLKQEGFMYNNKKFTVSINLIICDSPARSMVTCTKSHNAYFGCPRCIDEGDYLDHKMCFLSTKSCLRTDSSFSLRSNRDHHTAESPFEKIGLKMIDQFPLDVMHLRDLGIMKKILKLILSGAKKAVKLSAKQIIEMSEMLIRLKVCIPCEFVRKPRGLDELDRWKAVEFRLFLYYLGPIVLGEFLPEEYVIHFNSLHAALNILSDPKQYKENNKCADDLLHWYVQTFQTLYGESTVVFTVHCIQHLAEESLKHGPLDDRTAYPFENYMQTLKRMIHRPKDPLPQLFRGFVVRSEFSQLSNAGMNQPEKYPQFLKPYKTVVPFGCSEAYGEIRFRDFKLTIKQPDNCCYVDDGSVIFIEYITVKNGNPAIIGKAFSGLTTFPHYPGNSQELHLHVANGFSDPEIVSINRIRKKAVVLISRELYYILPLMHSSTCNE